MGSYFDSIDRFAVALTRGVIRWRWAVLAATVLAVLAIGSGAGRLEFANNYRVFFSQENPELQAFEKLQATYTKNDNFLFVLEPAYGDAFSGDTLEAVEMLTEEAWQIPYVIRVDSVSNFQHTRGIDDDLIVEDLVDGAASLTEPELREKFAIALAEPLLRDQLVSPDGAVTAVNVVLQYPEKSLTEVPEAIAKAREIRAGVEARFTGLDVHLTGVSALNNAFAEVGTADMGALVPIMFAVILLLTFTIIRSLAATFATLVLILLSVSAGMGAAGWLGISLTPISASAPIVILTLAIADSIHILVSLRGAMREGMEKIPATIEALRLNFMPVSITSVTTIIGFLALNFSDSPPFWHLGNITAIGIAAAWMLSITLLPALVSLLPVRFKAQVQRPGHRPPMDRLADFVIGNRRRLLAGVGAGALALVAFIPTLQLNDQWIEYFSDRIEFRNDSDAALEHFGMYPIEFSVSANGPGGVSEPEYLEKLDEFAQFLRSQPGVTHVYSFSDIMKRLNKNLHGDDEAWYRIPGDRELSAQYLLLYEISLPYGLDLNDRINVDKSATRVTATLGDVTSIETKQFLASATDWLQRNAPDYMQAKPTSAQVMFTYIAERNVGNMVGGTIAAILAISAILMLALRSPGLGALSLVPNGLPILATFGAWALIVGEVGFSVATVASISLGIVVDDTVHFLSKYARAQRERGLDTEASIRYAFSSVGTAIVVNTVILAVGFAVLTASNFKVNADMGLLTALAIVFALVLDFLLLPPLLLIRKEKQTMKHPLAKTAAALLAVSLALPVFATTPEQQGFDIAARSDRSDRGFGDSQVELQMILRNAAGQESTRQLAITTLEIPDEDLGDKSLVVFSTPRDIDGTALLSYAQILTPDDQWLYLPALKRVKRVSSANKSGPFVGSEFAFEDFTSLELNKFDYRYVGTAPCGDLTCDVVERLPRYENSGYTRQVAKIDQDVFQIREVVFYDRRGDLLKTLTMDDYRDYGDGLWRAHTLNMVNHQTGKSTDLVYGEYAFNTGLGDSDFVKGRLSRLR